MSSRTATHVSFVLASTLGDKTIADEVAWNKMSTGANNKVMYVRTACIFTRSPSVWAPLQREGHIILCAISPEYEDAFLHVRGRVIHLNRL